MLEAEAAATRNALEKRLCDKRLCQQPLLWKMAMRCKSGNGAPFIPTTLTAVDEQQPGREQVPEAWSALLHWFQVLAQQ